MRYAALRMISVAHWHTPYHAGQALPEAEGGGGGEGGV